MKTPNLGNTPVPSEFIPGEDKLTWPKLPPRSSMVIQEMELQPLMLTVPTVQRTPAIKAADMNGRSPCNDAV